MFVGITRLYCSTPYGFADDAMFHFCYKHWIPTESYLVSPGSEVQFILILRIVSSLCL